MQNAFHSILKISSKVNSGATQVKSLCLPGALALSYYILFNLAVTPYTLIQYPLNNTSIYLIIAAVKYEKNIICTFDNSWAKGSFLSNCSFSSEGSVVINGCD